VGSRFFGSLSLSGVTDRVEFAENEAERGCWKTAPF